MQQRNSDPARSGVRMESHAEHPALLAAAKEAARTATQIASGDC